MVIGKPLIQSQAFPPPHAVRATFTAHGVPSVRKCSLFIQSNLRYFLAVFVLVLSRQRE